MSALATASRDTHLDPAGEECFSDDAIVRKAGRVRAACADGTLTIRRFARVTGACLQGVSAEEAQTARERIYRELPDSLRLSYLGDVLTIASARGVGAQGGCRCCGQPFEPLKFVDEDRICELCWNLPRLPSGPQTGLQTPPADQPNPDQRNADLRRQLEIIAGDEPATSRVEVRWRNARGGMSRRFFGLGDVDRITSAIRNVQQIGDVFIGVAPRVREGGTARDVERVWSLWADLDSAAALQRVNQFKPAPTLIIETGSGGGHAYWQLSAPLPSQWAQRANRRLAKALGGDIASTDPARVLRPAGTLNWKHEPPRPVRCVRATLDAYTASEVVGRLPDDRDYKPAVNHAPPVNGDAGRVLDGLTRTVRDATQGERNRCLYWASCRAREHVGSGLLDEETACAALREAGLAAGLGELEVERTIRSGFEAVAA